MGLNNGFVDLSARFVGLNNGFVSLNNGFVNLNARFVDLNNGFVDLDRGFVDPKRYFYKKATDLIRPPARIPSPLPKEREQEVLAPFSLGRRVGEGLPYFVRRAVQIHARVLLRRSSEQTSTRSIALLKVYEV